MTTAEIILTGEGSAHHPSHPIAGMVAWNSDATIEGLELRLIYHTSGIGTQDVHTVATEKFLAPAITERRSFQFSLPNEVPWSFSGKLVSLMWKFELVDSDEELIATKEFVLSSTDQEIDLYAHAGGNPKPLEDA